MAVLHDVSGLVNSIAEPYTSSVLILCALVLVYVSYVAGHLSKGSMYRAVKPVVLSSWPIIGCIPDFAKDPHGFIGSCRRKWGDVFTIQLGPQRMTFLLHPDAFPTFFRAPDSKVSFRVAVEQFTGRVFGLPSKLFFPHHMSMLDFLRGQLGPPAVEQLAVTLAVKLEGELAQHSPKDWAEVDLVALLRRTVFAAMVKTLFGEAFGRRHDLEQLLEQFTVFEEMFEKAASPIPHVFFTSFRSSRSALLRAFQESLLAGDFACTTASPSSSDAATATKTPGVGLGVGARAGVGVGDGVDLVGLESPPLAARMLGGVGLPSALHPNALLALLWAALSNTIPTAFWTIAFLLLPEHTHYRSHVEEELQAAAGGGSAETGRLPQMVHKLVRGDPSSSILARCLKEALRLRSAGIEIRTATDALYMGDLFVPKGDLLALSPYEVHLDPRWHLDPLSFVPNRWCRIPLLAPDISFGGGRYRCPGRFLAEAEMRAIVAVFLYTLDMELIRVAINCKPSPGDKDGALPQPNIAHLVGVKHPIGQCFIGCKARGS